MIISEHLCGVAVAYDDNSGKRPHQVSTIPLPARAQGSLISYQKRKIADACEWLRTHSVYKPLIFVCTTSPNWGPEIYAPKISQFCHNLRNGYGCENYLWVREFNKSGSPHYHFCADMGRIHDPVALSLYWSNLFGYHTKNSVRLGTKPDPKTGKRSYYINSKKMAFYYAKYIGKELRKNIFENSWHSAAMPGRSFGISNQAAQQSAPIKYEVNFHFEEQPGEVMTANGSFVKRPSVCIGRSYTDELGRFFDKTDYSWHKCKDHSVYFGRKKER